MKKTKFFRVEEETSLKITLNRPEVGNAFHHEMILELTELFKNLNSRPDYKSVFISGSGKHFCTGADLDWMKSAALLNEKENLSQMEDLISMYKTISACPLPVVTYVHGCAYGGGIGLCSLSDFVISDSGAVFNLSELKYGLIPGALTPFLLSKIGKTKFFQLALDCHPFDSKTALDLGLITTIGSKEMAMEKLCRINEYPALALKNLKKSVQLFSSNVEEGFDKLKFLSSECRSDKESQQRMELFFKKN
jgi:methylglutaconyl-CoA hydratase